jgi:hypothetical protein
LRKGLAVHGISSEVIAAIVVCALIIVRFWRVLLMLLLCAMVTATLLGLVAFGSYIGH